MEGSYLSIDLDFWMHKDKRSSNPFFKRVFYYVREFGIPLHFVIEHEELLDDINSCENTSIERIGVCLSPLFVNEHSVEDVLYQFNISKERIKILLNQPVEHEYRKRGTLRQFVGV
jgi:hypothetical protein